MAATFAQGAAVETGLVDAAKPKARGESTAGAAAVVAAGCVVIRCDQFIVIQYLNLKCGLQGSSASRFPPPINNGSRCTSKQEKKQVVKRHINRKNWTV